MNSQKIPILKDRAEMLSKARSFFSERNILEVDCPILSLSAAIDAHIDLIHASYLNQETRYLHSSPEYGMKRLLATGMKDIYQLSHVFRDGEWGHKHNPEFMMAEWYRCEMPYKKFIEETINFIRLFLGDHPFEVLSYKDAFLKYTGINYLLFSEKDLIHYLNVKELLYPGLESEGKDALLNVILGAEIEPKLGNGQLTVLLDYPATQAALAQTYFKEDEKVAKRFEIYYEGMELANGYYELTDAAEQRKRFEESNRHRQTLGKQTLPIDENFLKALEKGLPDCCGVAVGFDRLMMLRHAASNIAEVIPFGWDQA